VSEFSNLARIVIQRRIKGKRFLIDFDAPETAGSAGKEQRLITLVMEKPSKTDLELTKDLYTVNNPANRAAFRQLRARVQEKLLNNLGFLDYSDQQGLVSRPFEIECRTLIYRAELLFLEGENEISLRLLQRCLKRSLEAEFTSLAEQAASRLTTFYAEALDWRNYEKYTKQLTAIRALQHLEQRADEVYGRFIVTSGRSVVHRRQSITQSELLLAELAKLHEQANSFVTFTNLYRAQLAYAEYVGLYDKVLQITQEAQQQFDEGKINVKRFDLRLNYYWIIYAHLRTRKIAEGLPLAEAYASAFHPVSSNWFFFYEHYLMLALHGQQYELALRLLEQVMTNPSLPKIRETARERWELLYAYTMLMQPPMTPAPTRRSIKVPISELTIPEYSRDKSGYNVFILIYQVLEFLRTQRVDEVLLRLESLRKYQQRHLKDSSLLRSRTFIRLLLLLPDNQFSAEQVLRSARVATQLEVLRNAPFVTEGSTEVEIIPYEHLWERIVHILQKNISA
jgi:hypothetical protein